MQGVPPSAARGVGKSGSIIPLSPTLQTTSPQSPPPLYHPYYGAHFKTNGYQVRPPASNNDYTKMMAAMRLPTNGTAIEGTMSGPMIMPPLQMTQTTTSADVFGSRWRIPRYSDCFAALIMTLEVAIAIFFATWLHSEDTSTSIYNIPATGLLSGVVAIIVLNCLINICATVRIHQPLRSSQPISLS